MTDALELTRRSLLAGFATLAMAAPGLPVQALAQAAGGPGAPSSAIRGGRMAFGRYTDSQFLDPVTTELNADIWVLTNLFDTLLSPTPDGKGLQPGLATEWKWSDDRLSLELTLRPGVKFADGSDLTPTDVVWSLDRARGTGAWKDLIGSIKAVEPGEGKITIRLDHPDATLLAALATFNTGIMPRKLVEAAPGATVEDKMKAFAEKPIGTGPFMLASWQRGQTMLLKRNPFHWRMAGDGKPLPYLDELRFDIVPDDATRLLKLKAGELDGTEFVPYARVKELQADPTMRMELWPSTRIRYIGLNCRPEYKGRKNPMADARVRQAINHAVNKDAIIAITTQGLGKPMRSFMSSTTPLFSGPASGALYPYDLAKAKALMAEAGYAEGFEVSCQTISGNQDDVNDLTAIQQMLAAIRIKVTIEQLDNATKVARYRAGDFQLRTALWTNDIADPAQITSYFAYYPNVENVRSGYRNPKLDELYLASSKETDLQKRTAMYQEIQQTYAEAAPILFLYETPYPVAFRKQATGFVQIPLGNNLFAEAAVQR